MTDLIRIKSLPEELLVSICIYCKNCTNFSNSFSPHWTTGTVRHALENVCNRDGDSG